MSFEYQNWNGELVTARETRLPGDEPPEPIVEAQRFPFLTIDELAALEPPRWLVHSLLPEAALTILYGPPGEGKTFVALDMALCVAGSLPWHGRPVRGGRVLYALGEGRGAFGNRIKAWDLGRAGNQLEKCKPTFRLCPAVPPLLDALGVIDFLSALKTLEPPPVLVVLDTLSRCITGGDENGKDMPVAVSGMDIIRQGTGACVLAVHHTGKDKERGARGHSSLQGGADTMLSCSKDTNGIKLAVEKQKDSEAGPPVALKLEVVDLGPGPDGPVTSCRVRLRTKQELDQELTDGSRAMLALLLRKGNEAGLTKTDIEGLLEISKATFYRNVGPLLESQAVAKEGYRYRAEGRPE